MALRERLVPFGLASRRVRLRVGQTQAELGRRVRKSQSWVSRVESGTLVSLTVADADALCRALGSTLVFTIETPVFIGGDRQRDLAHARCLAFVVRRLARAGWQVEREVQIGDPRRPGWIDVLAYNPISRTLLIIEIKTRLDDFGGLERQLQWYRQHAQAAARRMGWQAEDVTTAALLLATEVNDQRVRENASSIRQRFPGRWRELAAIASGDPTASLATWSLAMIDPHSRASTWCRPTVLDGRRSAAPYVDVGDFLEQRTSRSALCRGH